MLRPGGRRQQQKRCNIELGRAGADAKTEKRLARLRGTLLCPNNLATNRQITTWAQHPKCLLSLGHSLRTERAQKGVESGCPYVGLPGSCVGFCQPVKV